MNEIRLEFDGLRLSAIDTNSGMTLDSWAAISGNAGKQNPSLSGESDVGPIPQGNWTINAQDLTRLIDLPPGRILLSEFGMMSPRGGFSSWGHSFVPIEPTTGTNTHGRNGFHIHGGSTPGSAGCIDLVGGMDEFWAFMRQYKGQISLVVDYSHNAALLANSTHPLLQDLKCFPAQTPIAISPTQTKPIADIRVGDVVMSYARTALGRGALVPRRVVRLYRNTTREWVRLTWAEGGEAKELISTPGHHFLDQFGNFPTIEEMLDNGRATVILASGEPTEVTAERIIYTADTAHLFEQAQAVGMIAGNAALKTAKSVSYSPRYFATKVITFIIFASLSSVNAMADEPFNLRVERVNQVLEELPVGGTKPVSEFIKSGNVENVCLVSTDTGIELNAGGCYVNSSSLVAVSRSKECSIVSLSQVTSRILSGSIDVECRLMSPSLALTKIARYGQTHILLIQE